MNNLCAAVLAGLDKEVDDIEDVDGRPREEEHNTHPNQNTGTTIVLKELKLIIYLFPTFELCFDDKKSCKIWQMERKSSFELHITFRLSEEDFH